MKKRLVDWIRLSFDVRDVVVCRNYKDAPHDGPPVVVVHGSIDGRGVIGGRDRLVDVNGLDEEGNRELLTKLIDAPARSGTTVYVFFRRSTGLIAQFEPPLLREPLEAVLSVAAAYPSLQYRLSFHPGPCDDLKRPCSILWCTEDEFGERTLDPLAVSDLFGLAHYRSGVGDYTDITGGDGERRCCAVL